MSAKACFPESVEFVPVTDSNKPFSYPRDFLDHRFVYLTVSPRARGLSVGINFNPDRMCNFDCVYCEVKREQPPAELELDVPVMADELQKVLSFIWSGQIRYAPPYSRLNEDLLKLRHVALSGDGEPTLCPKFVEAVQAVAHVRSRALCPFFKIVLLTNGTGLDAPGVQEGLSYFTADDEVWIKLDCGTQAYMDRINRSKVPLSKVLANALDLGRKRPVVIQSLFTAVDGTEPPVEEIDQYIQRLNELKQGGAQIAVVQIYSATRPTAHYHCTHLPLRSLSLISRRIRTETGLKAEVF